MSPQNHPICVAFWQFQIAYPARPILKTSKNCHSLRTQEHCNVEILTEIPSLAPVGLEIAKDKQALTTAEKLQLL